MANKKDTKKDQLKPAPPSSGMAFIVGLVLFGMILCPTGLFLFYNLRMFRTLGMMQLPTLALGCLTGLIIAVIPAFIFMHLTMKKLRA
jgi:hypothetical protein